MFPKNVQFLKKCSQNSKKLIVTQKGSKLSKFRKCIGFQFFSRIKKNPRFQICSGFFKIVLRFKICSHDSENVWELKKMF